ncbi:hypothetical protein A2U01_0108042, partial [Trifolium medium]|nr:hypothetical protein [Trifolium medium]
MARCVSHQDFITRRVRIAARCADSCGTSRSFIVHPARGAG